MKQRASLGPGRGLACYDETWRAAPRFTLHHFIPGRPSLASAQTETYNNVDYRRPSDPSGSTPLTAAATPHSRLSSCKDTVSDNCLSFHSYLYIFMYSFLILVVSRTFCCDTRISRLGINKVLSYLISSYLMNGFNLKRYTRSAEAPSG